MEYKLYKVFDVQVFFFWKACAGIDETLNALLD